MAEAVYAIGDSGLYAQMLLHICFAQKHLAHEGLTWGIFMSGWMTIPLTTCQRPWRIKATICENSSGFSSWIH